MRVHLLRHGESRSNAHPTAVALPEAEGDALTARGREQAMTAARALASLPADVLLTSPMRRAVQTAEVLAPELGLAPLVDADLHEVRESSDFAALAPEE